MSLTVESSEQGTATVLKLSGRIDGGPETKDVHERIKALVEGGKKSIVLDMTAVPWANSLGIGVLIAAYATAKREGARIAVGGVSERVYQVLKVCGVVPTVFEVHDDAAAAVAALT